MNDQTISRWPNRGALILWGVALFGYFAPWIGREPMSAALAWNAYDLFDLLRLLPEVESGAIRVNLQTLQLPLVGLAVLLPLLLYQADRRLRWAAGIFGGILAALTLPSYPQILDAWRTPGWSGVLAWAVVGTLLALGFVPLAPRLKRYRGWIVIAAVSVTSIPSTVTLHRLLPLLSRLHAAPVHAGWGHWMYMVGISLVGVSAWLQTILQGANYENQRATDASPSKGEREIRAETS